MIRPETVCSFANLNENVCLDPLTPTVFVLFLFLMTEPVGESYDEYLNSLMNAADIQSDDGYVETKQRACLHGTDTRNIERPENAKSSTTGSVISSRSPSTRSSQSKIAAAAPTMCTVATDGFGYFETRTSHRDLYDMRPSRVAVEVEGYNYSQTMTPNMIQNTTNPKVAGCLNGNVISTNHNHYGESNVATPEWTPVSYIYCRA